MLLLFFATGGVLIGSMCSLDAQTLRPCNASKQEQKKKRQEQECSITVAIFL